MRSRHVAYISFSSCFVTFILDQATKYTFFDGSSERSPFSFFGGLLTHTLHRNSGITFNIPIPKWIILSLSIIAVGFILSGIYYAMRRLSCKEGLALGILLGGTLGNFIDRWTLDYVRDWILAFQRSAFNFADIFILVGLISYLFLQRPSSPRTTAAALPQEEG